MMDNAALLESAESLQSNLMSQSMTDMYDDKPVKYQSFGVALLNFLNTIIGAEILGVANSMTFCGVAFSVFLMAFTAILSYIGTVLVLNLHRFVNAESINDMATKVVGRWFGNLFSAITLCFTFSNVISYLIVGSNTICEWLELAGGAAKEWTTGWKRSVMTLAYALVLPVALSIPKQMEFIDTASMFAIVAQLTFVVTMIIEGVKFFPTYPHWFHPTCETAVFDIHFFNAFAIYSTLYALPAVILPQLEPFDPSLKKRYWLLGVGFVLCFIIDIVPSTIGYLICGIHTDQIVLHSEYFQKTSSGKTNVLIQVCNAGFFFVVNASYPLVSLQITTDLGAIIYKEHNPRKVSWKKRIILLLITNIPPIIIAMVMPNVRPIFEVGGAFGGCLSNFLFPPILYWWNSGKKWYHIKSLLLMAFAGFGLLSAAIGTWQAVVDAIDSFKNGEA